jgi:hypothetical protein
LRIIERRKIMSLLNRLLQRISGQSRQCRARRRTAFCPFGIEAAQVETLETRRLLSALTVTTAADSGAGSLRADIAAANNGDTINFASSLKGKTITLTSGELLINKALTIQGPGAAQLTISGGNASRVFDVTSSQPVVLAGLTVSNGVSAATGGGIYNTGTLTVNQCTISGDQARGLARGGGIFNSGVLWVSGSTISNSVARQGGGIFNQGMLTANGCTVSGNRGSFGGGICNERWLTASGCTVSGNRGSSGGGIYNLEGGSYRFALTDCTLSENVGGAGGGLYDLVIGVGIDDTLTNCTISLNSATSFEGGGGIYVSNGLTNGYSNIPLFNNIVAGNTYDGTESSWGADISGGFDLNNCFHNLIGNGDGSDIQGHTNIVGGSAYGGGIINARLGPLQNNGGPTMTMALLAGSPAIGQAANGLAPATDQRGVTRRDLAGEFTDIGAYEV